MGARQLVRRILHAFGYDIIRLPGANHAAMLELYFEHFPRSSVEQRRFYNIGAGAFRHPAWTNVDFVSPWYKHVHQAGGIDIEWNLMSLTPMPLEDNCAEVVYTSHTIEHVSDQAAMNLFAEVHRCLKAGGIFRLTMPNIDLAYRAYRRNDRSYFYWIDDYKEPEVCQRVCLNGPLTQASIQQILLWHFATSVSVLHLDGAPHRISDEELDNVFRESPYETALDYCTSQCSFESQERYPGNHINWWNLDKSVRMLRSAGFKQIDPSGYGQSTCPILRDTRYFDNTYPKASLYVEAVK